MLDKNVILAERGKLTDRHMYAAHKLIAMQFSKIEGCHSTLLVQKMAYPPVSSVSSRGIV